MGAVSIPPSLSAPEPLAVDHELESFDSGIVALDEWLKRRARRNELEGASRTFVVSAGRRVVGYYSLAAGSVSHHVAIGKIRRNMPDPVPVVLLGRLATDRAWQGRGLGADMLRDVTMRALAVAEIIGARAILAHAISSDAKAFYERHGFRPSPVEPMTLMITIEEARKITG
jgi:GNAT superfamily N-acetyltransferase